MARKTWTPGQVLTASDLNTLVVQAAPGSSRTLHIGTFSGTTNGTGDLTVTHGAGFTPTVVCAQIGSPSGGGNIVYTIVTAITATTFTIRAAASAGSNATLAITGYYMCAA